MVKKMSLKELQKPYPGPFSIKNNNLSLTEKKQNNIKMLKDQYNYYLTRYMNAYDQYLAYKSPHFYNKPELANKFKPVVFTLNNKLIDIANTLNQNVEQTYDEHNVRRDSILNQNDQIAQNHQNQIVLNKVIKDKNMNNSAQSQKISDIKEILNSILIKRNLLIGYTIISIVIATYLIYQVNKS